MAKTVVLDPVMTKARKRFGKVYDATPTEYKATIVPGQSITVECEKNTRNEKGQAIKVQHTRTFNVGDTAEYDSYNLNYLGVITKISAKTVTIVAYKGTNMETVHRLDIHHFCWRNYNLNVEETTARNHDTMMYI